MSARPIGVLVMAYGTASGPDDVERYYTDIRGGRRPTPEHLEELRERYAAIGNRFPLLDITRRQAEGLERELNRGEAGAFRAYLGMKHSPPFIAEAVERMRGDGIERAIGIVMAPHWSGMSVESYVERVREQAGEGPPAFDFVRSYHDDPGFVSFLAARVADALSGLSAEERRGSTVVFSAHSLPTRTVEDGSLRCLRCNACEDACRYRD
ncbi:MAG TPA: ferrochelatase, partial [Actinomycetota bacterium]|nr:ferrochelatase [Actinomycetota bacterium]